MSNPDDEEQRNQILNNTKLLRRAQINLVRSKIDSIEQILANQEIDTIDNNGILAKKQTLCDKLVAIDELNASILGATSEQNIEDEVKSAAEFRELVLYSINKIDEFLIKNTSKPVTESKKLPHLPKIVIPPFEGDTREWDQFWDLFHSCIHTNTSLDEVQKFNYLYSLLRKEAKEAVRGIRNAGENYNKLVETLKTRFHRPSLVRDHHLNALLNIKPVESYNDHKKLRSLYDEIFGHVSSLETAGVNKKTFESFLVPMIMRVLPRNLVIEIKKDLDPSEEFDVDCVLAKILSHIEIREKCETALPGTSYNAGKIIKKKSVANIATASGSESDLINAAVDKILKSMSYRDNRYASTAKTAVADSKSVNSNNHQRWPCIFCNKVNHKSQDCRSVNTFEERINHLKVNNNCFVCLSNKHLSRDCKTKNKCPICTKRHHVSICKEFLSGSKNNFSNEKPKISNVDFDSVANSNDNDASLLSAGSFSSFSNNQAISKVILQTAKVNVVNTDTKQLEPVRLLFDTGSEFSHIKTNISKKLDLPVLGKQTFSMNTFANVNPKITECEKVKLTIERNGVNIEVCCYTNKHICNNIPSVELNESQIAELRQFKLADPQILFNKSLSIDVIIGCDYYADFMTTNVVKTNFGPNVIRSKIGDLVYGKICSENAHFVGKKPLICNFVSQLSINDNYPRLSDLDSKVDRLWNLESLGILPTDEQEVVHQQFNDSIKEVPIKNGEVRYELELPWKTNVWTKLPDNRHVAVRRLDNLLQKTAGVTLDGGINKQLEPGDPNLLLTEYDKIIQKQLDEGIISQVDETTSDNYLSEKTNVNAINSNVNKGLIHYLPHRHVFRPEHPTTKVRIVFDGSCKTINNLSLNDCLHKGLALQAHLCKILLNWRLYPIAIACDIKSAFHQLLLCEQDRDSTRFLWRRNGDLDNPLIAYRSNRVLFGLSSSPYLLCATIIYHLSKFIDKSHIAKLLNESNYVDDFLFGAFNKDEAISHVINSQNIMLKASMPLRKFNSSSQTVRDFLKNEHIVEDTPEISKILGMVWNSKLDTLSYNFHEMPVPVDSKQFTKRELLSLFPSIYDPCGLICPLILKPKLIFQQTCKIKLKWDDVLPTQYQSELSDWLSDIQSLKTLSLNRYLFNNIDIDVSPDTEINLHAYGDASCEAYACCVYVEIVTPNDNCDFEPRKKLIMAKSRVAPLKNLSIPRLELIASLLTARLVTTVKQFLHLMKISNIYCYTDSLTVLHWLKGEAKVWAPFVSRRVSEIHTLISPNQWFFIEGEKNPADIASRPISYHKFVNCELWWTGPPNNCAKPVCDIVSEIPAESLIELRKKSPAQIAVKNNDFVADHVFSKNVQGKIVSLLETSSNLNILLDSTAVVYQFIDILKHRESNFVENRQKALNCWIKSEQIKYFPIESANLVHNEPEIMPPACYKPPSSIIKQLGLFKSNHDDLIRCRTRFAKADISFDAKYPILLAPKSKLTRMIVLDSHIKNYHSSVNYTLSSLRSKYWIVSGKTVVKSIIEKHCMTCKILKAKPYNLPQSPPLPEFRVTKSTPFTFCALDFLGPIYCKNPNKTLSKSYVLLITCATTRAVHLEVCTSMSAKCFMLSLERFFGRRGFPKFVLSDNFSTFIKVRTDLTQFLSEIKKFAYDLEITWVFSPEYAPWYNGISESLVKSVKTPLKKTLSHVHVSFEEKTTILCKIEFILNNRPLIILENSDIDCQPLTPFSLMGGGEVISNLPPLNLIKKSDFKIDSIFVERRIKYIDNLVNNFWNKWSKNYLQELSQFHFAARGRKKLVEKIPKIGEFVLIKDDKLSRNLWPLGEIIDILPSRDRNIRKCLVRTANLSKKGDKKVKTIHTRAANMLVPLELNDDN